MIPFINHRHRRVSHRFARDFFPKGSEKPAEKPAGKRNGESGLENKADNDLCLFTDVYSVYSFVSFREEIAPEIEGQIVREQMIEIPGMREVRRDTRHFSAHWESVRFIFLSSFSQLEPRGLEATSLGILSTKDSPLLSQDYTNDKRNMIDRM